MPRFREISPDSLSSVVWEVEVEKLNNVHLTLMGHQFGLLRSFVGLPISASLRETYIRLLEIVKSSFDARSVDRQDGDDVARVNREIAYDLYLSVYGIGCCISSSKSSHAAGEGGNLLLDSQADTLPSSPPRLASPPSTPAWSQVSDFEATDEEDPAMALLRGYTGTGKFVPKKRFELLDKWDLGAEPSSYAFDLDRSGDADAVRQRRAKQLAREDRKRRRAETLLHLSQEPELPATQPAPEIRFHSSQPRGFSSQRQILHSDPLQTMSQPASGIFGRRPNKKAKKRKGGF
jgi:RNA polymerase I-specific transcription initiation factor RRN6